MYFSRLYFFVISIGSAQGDWLDWLADPLGLDDAQEPRRLPAHLKPETREEHLALSLADGARRRSRGGCPDWENRPSAGDVCATGDVCDYVVQGYRNYYTCQWAGAEGRAQYEWHLWPVFQCPDVEPVTGSTACSPTTNSFMCDYGCDSRGSCDRVYHCESRSDGHRWQRQNRRRSEDDAPELPSPLDVKIDSQDEELRRLNGDVGVNQAQDEELRRRNGDDYKTGRSPARCYEIKSKEECCKYYDSRPFHASACVPGNFNTGNVCEPLMFVVLHGMRGERTDECTDKKPVVTQTTCMKGCNQDCTTPTTFRDEHWVTVPKSCAEARQILSRSVGNFQFDKCIEKDAAGKKYWTVYTCKETHASRSKRKSVDVRLLDLEERLMPLSTFTAEEDFTPSFYGDVKPLLRAVCPGLEPTVGDLCSTTPVGGCRYGTVNSGRVYECTRGLQGPRWRRRFRRLSEAVSQDEELRRLNGDVKAFPRSSEQAELRNAARIGDVAKVKRLLTNGADVNAKDNFGFTALHHATLHGHACVVQVLLTNGALVDAKTNIGKTALHYASYEGQAGVVQVLVNHGANVNAKRANDGWTSLHYATQRGRLGVVQLLVNHGADVNARNIYGATALILASTNGHHEIAEFLEAHGASSKSRANVAGRPTSRSTSPYGIQDELNSAARSGDVAKVELLVKNGADVNAKTSTGITALHYASDNGHAGVAQALVNHRANVNAKNNDANTALHLASRVGSLPVVKLLVNNRADVNAKNNRGETARYLASRVGNARYQEIVKFLEGHGGL